VNQSPSPSSSQRSHAGTRSSLEHSHEPSDIATRIAAPNSQSYLKDGIYGAIDGAVTTFAVVSGVAGAGLSPSIVIVLGVANLVGDGFSMAAGNFLGTRAENQQLEKLRAIEQKHIRECPEGEREEVRQILVQQGFSGELLEQAVTQLTSNEQTWIDTMLRHEYGYSTDRPGAIRAALTTFISFMLIGAIPLIPFLLTWQGILATAPFMLSSVMTAIAFFVVGAIKSNFVQQRWWLAGAETLTVGAIAAALAYLCGHLLSSIVT
jgi:VIT1/CCC1 family predicted Fe2+/Mn2+ transporter